MEESYQKLQLFTKFHTENIRMVSRKQGGYKNIKEIPSYLKALAEVKLPEIYMKYAK
jgi:hypothetical protein